MTPISNEAIQGGCNSPWDADVDPFTFFFTRNDPILFQGIGNTTAFFIGRNAFYKSVCNFTLWAVYCLLFILKIPSQNKILYKV